MFSRAGTNLVVSGPRKPCSPIVARSPPCPTLRLVSDWVFFLVSRCITSSFILHVLRHLAVFSDRFSEGTLKNLKDGFPPDEEPYTDSYEYPSDSDLDEVEGDTEADGSPNDGTVTDHPACEKGSTHTKRPSPSTIGHHAQQAAATLVGDPATTHVQPGKVAIIRDMAATT